MRAVRATICRVLLVVFLLDAGLLLDILVRCGVVVVATTRMVLWLILFALSLFANRRCVRSMLSIFVFDRDGRLVVFF